MDSCAARSGMFSSHCFPSEICLILGRNKRAASGFFCSERHIKHSVPLTRLMLVDNNSVVLKINLPSSLFRKRRANIQAAFKAHSPDQLWPQRHLVTLLIYQPPLLINKTLRLLHGTSIFCDLIEMFPSFSLFFGSHLVH